MYATTTGGPIPNASSIGRLHGTVGGTWMNATHAAAVPELTAQQARDAQPAGALRRFDAHNAHLLAASSASASASASAPASAPAPAYPGSSLSLTQENGNLFGSFRCVLCVSRCGGRAGAGASSRRPLPLSRAPPKSTLCCSLAC